MKRKTFIIYHKQLLIICTLLTFSVGQSNADIADRGSLDAPLDCVIEPYLVTEVSSSVNGIIQEVYVRKGDIIKKGQKIALLESSVETATVALANAKSIQKEDLLTKRLNWNFYSGKERRVLELFKTDAVTSHEKEEAEMNAEIARLEYKQAKAQRNIAKLELERAQAALALRTIRSPLAGVVVNKYLSPGESTVDRALFKMAQLNPLRVIVIAQSKTFGEVQPGMTAKVRTIINPNVELTATVDIVAPVLDAASGTYDITLALSNPKHDLPGGLRCHIQFDLE